MNFNEYEEACMQTFGHLMGPDLDLVFVALGVAGEAGEIADAVKKIVAHGHSYDKLELAEEIGDVLWYLAAMARIIGVPLQQIAEDNLKKLAEKYPGGYNPERSQNRASTH